MENSEFEKELRSLLNKYGQERDSDTPDMILAQYLVNCLGAYNLALQSRIIWYGHDLSKNIKITIGEDK